MHIFGIPNIFVTRVLRDRKEKVMEEDSKEKTVANVIYEIIIAKII